MTCRAIRRRPRERSFIHEYFDKLSAQIAWEGEQTRRLMAAAFEEMMGERSPVLDESRANAERLKDHERRIGAPERRK